MPPPPPAPAPPAPSGPAASPHAAPIGPVDPHGIGPAVANLGLFQKRAGKVAFTLLAHILEAGERVEVLAQGKVLGEDGAAVLTDRRVLVVNDREWKPDVFSIDLGSDLTVQGWQDDRAASLTFQRGSKSVTIEGIADRDLAQRMAALVRARAAG